MVMVVLNKRHHDSKKAVTSVAVFLSIDICDIIGLDS